MAIEHRALFALSIAFTASLVAYPDLPANIPPRLGWQGAFIGAPFVAFLLPSAACLIWWLLVRVNRSAATAADAARASASTALFLSAFHVTMLIAFIGTHVWLARILGALVGVFLIATGNEFPRLRRNLVWGIRTAQTLGSDEVWRRVHRLGGYIRVVMGVAVCAASLAGAPGAAELIVFAIGLETVVCVGAGAFSARRHGAIVSGLIVCCIATAVAEAQTIPREKIETLPVLIDAEVPKLMEERHAVGTAVAVVHEGRTLLLRGYGKARLDSGAAADPRRTVFRVGSVTKVFTAAAAVQLAEAGRLDLHRDIREYLPDIPLPYGATTHQLLTHTAGLDERFAGAYTESPQHLQSLTDHLRRYLPAQVFRPGTASSYSNYNYALAGLVVERLSGLTYEQYLADRIFAPLGMRATSVLQPRPSSPDVDLARGYRWTAGGHEPVPYVYTQASPAGSMTTTAADMGRFMLAMLADGWLDGRRILTPASMRLLLRQQYTPHPRIAGTTYGFTPMIVRGRHLLVRGGTLGDQASLMVLVPADKLGIFVASTTLPGVGDFLFEPLLTHLAGPVVPPPAAVPLPEAGQRAPHFAGTYRAYRQTRDEMSRIRTLLPMMQPRVTVEADGAIGWQGRRWVEVEPLLFRSVDSGDYIVFRANGRGEITGVGGYERIGWREQTWFQLSVLASCVIAFVAYPLTRGIRAVGKSRTTAQGRGARMCAVFVAVANLAFVAGLIVYFMEFGRVIPLPAPIAIWLSIPLVSVAVTALLPAFAVLAWKNEWWTRGERIGYSAFAVLAVTFMTFLNYWKLLGIRY